MNMVKDPKAVFIKLNHLKARKELIIYHNWVTLENQALASQYHVIADGA